MFACDELTASLWRVDRVTSRPGDELTVWRVDCVTSWPCDELTVWRVDCHPPDLNSNPNRISCWLASGAAWVMPGFQHYVSGAVLPLCRCQIPLLPKNTGGKFRCVRAVNGKNLPFPFVRWNRIDSYFFRWSVTAQPISDAHSVIHRDITIIITWSM